MKQNYMNRTAGFLLAAGMLVSGMVNAQDKARPAQSHTQRQSSLQVGDNGQQHLFQPGNTGNVLGGGCDSLKTTFAMGNGNDGIMFDVVANYALKVTFFDAILTGTSGYVHVYRRAGTHIGHDMTPGDWTLVDSVFMNLPTSDSLYRVPVYVSLDMNAGDTAGFYISGSQGLAVDYTDGTTLGAVFTQDAGLKALEGTGKGWPFQSNFTPRVFNGVINYCPYGFDPCNSSTTTFAGGNGYDGNMFDLTSDYDITINGFYGNINGSGPMEVYYHPGTYVGTETNSAAWTRLDSASVTSMGANVPTYLPFSINLPVVAGQTIALYITGTASGADVNYSNGTAVGNVAMFDGVVTVKEGMGMPYPFTSGATPRVWNGTVNYCLGITGVPSLENNSGVTSTVYPNPVNNTATLSIASDKQLDHVSVVITDVTGRTVQQLTDVNGNTVQLDAAAMTSGLYFYNVYSSGSLVNTGKFIVE